MNIYNAKINMVKQQIRTWHVLDDKILALFTTLPREDFVPSKYRRLAYADMQIPLDHHQYMMPPQVEARMIEALNITPSDKILEIGTGSGYITAALAKLGQHVYSVDLYEDFLSAAENKLKQLDIQNVTLQVGDAKQGWEKQQPYDVISISASMPILPINFRQQLKIGGRLFVILGQAPAMHAMLITRSKENEWDQKILFETDIPPLVKALELEHFTF